MKKNLSIKYWNPLLSSVLRFLMVFFIIAVILDLKIPIVSGEKSNFIILIHIGIAVCLASNWRFFMGLKWRDRINLIGSLLGAAATLVIVCAFKGVNIPFCKGYTKAFQALAVLLLLKVGLKILQVRREKTYAANFRI
jgi:hypothetical protein